MAGGPSTPPCSVPRFPLSSISPGWRNCLTRASSSLPCPSRSKRLVRSLYGPLRLRITNKRKSQRLRLRPHERAEQYMIAAAAKLLHALTIGQGVLAHIHPEWPLRFREKIANHDHLIAHLPVIGRQRH